VAQVVGPEFKPQDSQKKKEEQTFNSKIYGIFRNIFVLLVGQRFLRYSKSMISPHKTTIKKQVTDYVEEFITRIYKLFSKLSNRETTQFFKGVQKV
jgi:hypothetical protein